MRTKGLKKVFKINSRGKRTNKVDYYVKETDRGEFHIWKEKPKGVRYFQWHVDYFVNGEHKEYVTNVGGSGYSCLESAVNICEYDLAMKINNRVLRLAAN